MTTDKDESLEIQRAPTPPRFDAAGVLATLDALELRRSAQPAAEDKADRAKATPSNSGSGTYHDKISRHSGCAVAGRGFESLLRNLVLCCPCILVAEREDAASPRTSYPSRPISRTSHAHPSHRRASAYTESAYTCRPISLEASPRLRSTRSRISPGDGSTSVTRTRMSVPTESLFQNLERYGPEAVFEIPARGPVGSELAKPHELERYFRH